ncbi:uncharacterized protein B0H18DRAFT_67400 [Fomitopsis serialis]|uniref:uncharacterized protein n=1 Tax=Fomitopsis serialis TaxID=139415 RepID=UPI0020074688|nr:uncharacterized protein B0H18DRAFT_67400 [Neoantrodia serialis]KAH9931798.1 hypothetical protein B0H18DRAFT_67400 [Neoantrodia serialis]
MDPFSTAAAGLDVLGLVIKTLQELFLYVKSVKNAPSAVQKLQEELVTTQGTFKFAEHTFTSLQRQRLSEHALGVLTRFVASDGPLKQSLKELEALDTRLSNALNAKGRLRRWFKRLKWPLSERETDDINKLLAKTTTELNTTLQLVLAEQVSHIHVHTQETRHTVRDIREEQRRVEVQALRRGEEHTYESLLAWLSPMDSEEKYRRSLNLRVKGSGQWVLRHATFKSWYNSVSSILWINGNPGSGKTILVSSVIKGILKFEEPDEALAFHFCDFSDAVTTDPVEVLRALLAQLIQSGGVGRLSKIPELVAQMKERKLPPASVHDLDLLLKATADGRKIIIVLDALDECPNPSKKTLLDCLSRLVLHETAHIRLLLSSRKHEDIANALRGCLSICLEDIQESRHHLRDMELYIDDALRTRDRLSDLPLHEKVRVKDSLLNGADGMFRWIDCQFDMLCRRGWTVGGIAQVLSSLPHGLESTYERIFSEVERNGEDALMVVNRALMWLITTLRPLTENEILEALMIEKGRPTLNQSQRLWRPDDLLYLCSSLVYVEPTTGCIKLSHYSVREFILYSSRARRFLHMHNSDLSAVRSETSKLMLTYLMINDFKDAPINVEHQATASIVGGHTLEKKRDQESILEEHPFALYAAPWWSDHLSRIDRLDDELLRLAVAFVAKPSYRRKPHNWLRHHYKELKALFSYGLDVARRITDQNAALLNEDITLNGTPLINAISRSDKDMVVRLLEAGADPDRISSSPFAQGGAYLPTTPLWFALRTEDSDLVQLLLNHNATVHWIGSPEFDAVLLREVANHEAEERKRRSMQGLPVHVQSDSTHREHESHPRIGGNTDLTIRATPGGAVVPYVARPDALFVETMRLVMDAAHDENGEDVLGLTALQVACMLRSTDMVVCLLQHGADVGELCEPWLAHSDLQWAASQWWCPEHLRHGAQKLSGMGIALAANGVSPFDGISNSTPETTSVASEASSEDEEPRYIFNDPLYASAVALSDSLNMTMNWYLLDECESEPYPESFRLTPLQIACKLRDGPMARRLLAEGAGIREAREPWLSEADADWVREQHWWKTRSASKRSNNDSSANNGDYIPRDERDVIDTVVLLEKGWHLPAEVVRYVLDLAEYWLRTSVTRSDCVLVERSAAEQPYLTLKLPTQAARIRRPLRRVVFE